MAQSSPATPAAAVVVGDKDNGRAVTLAVGQQLRVVLGSTYWQFDDAAYHGVLRSVGSPKTRPEPTSCVPGGGCGTVTATFVAGAAGRTDVTAHRSSCGEAMGCTARTGSFRLHVVVTS
jgi:hypothetical protein